MRSTATSPAANISRRQFLNGGILVFKNPGWAREFAHGLGHGRNLHDGPVGCQVAAQDHQPRLTTKRPIQRTDYFGIDRYWLIEHIRQGAVGYRQHLGFQQLPELRKHRQRSSAFIQIFDAIRPVGLDLRDL